MDYTQDEIDQAYFDDLVKQAEELIQEEKEEAGRYATARGHPANEQEEYEFAR